MHVRFVGGTGVGLLSGCGLPTEEKQARSEIIHLVTKGGIPRDTMGSFLGVSGDYLSTFVSKGSAKGDPKVDFEAVHRLYMKMLRDPEAARRECAENGKGDETHVSRDEAIARMVQQ